MFFSMSSRDVYGFGLIWASCGPGPTQNLYIYLLSYSLYTIDANGMDFVSSYYLLVNVCPTCIVLFSEN